MKKGEIVWVECSYTVPVIVPYDDFPVDFMIEENSCPGTGLVGSALDQIIEKSDKDSSCWACLLHGKNSIVTAPDNSEKILLHLKK